MNSNFKSYQKALKNNPRVVDPLEGLERKPASVPGLEQLLGQKPATVSENNDSVKADNLNRLEGRDRALRQKMIDDLEKEIEQHRQLRAQKKAEEEKQAQAVLTQQQQAQGQRPNITLPSNNKPKRGGAFLGLGKKKKGADLQIKRTKQEMVASKGGG